MDGKNSVAMVYERDGAGGPANSLALLEVMRLPQAYLPGACWDQNY